VANADLARVFREMAQLLEIRGESVFRVRAYDRAADVLDGLSEDVGAVVARKELSKIPGIGKGLAAHVREYLAAGSIAEVEALRAQVPAGVRALLGVRGLGPKTARLLFERLGVDSLEALEQAAVSGTLLDLPGMGERTRQNILQGIRSVRAGQARLPLGRALALAESIRAALHTAGHARDIEIAGSARRRRETVGDLDLLVTSREPGAVIEDFVRLPGIAQVLARGDTKVSVRHAVEDAPALQVDLRVVEPEALGAALQYFTGSKDHNVRVREIAQRRQLKLSEYGVFDERTGRRVAGATEEEVYAAVELPWIPPELRENGGEIEAALLGTLPALVRLEDIRGDLHAHTNWSDGRLTLEELIQAAEARGWEYLAVTDHSRSSTIANGLSPEELRAQVRAIRNLQPRHRIRILAGTECDILADGQLDFPDELLGELDFVLAAVHSRFSQAGPAMTARIARALEHPMVDVLVHPTGRRIGEREPYDIDLDALCAIARRHDKALEINGSPARLDLKDSHARRAAELGVRVAIDTDLHTPADAQNMALGVATARRAWIAPQGVVNTLPVGWLREWAGRHRAPR
jgi:DNA polymerase (family 10)